MCAVYISSCLLVLGLLLCNINNVSSRFTECGGWIENEKGYIQSPKFPARFPTPINCVWVIHNPKPEKKIIMYFTQYFLENSFHLSEYDQYQNEHQYSGVRYLGEINHEDGFASLSAYKPYLVIRFKVHEIGTMHLRVEEFLKDVYGFNITYEVINKEMNISKTCSAQDCSFLGHCLANADFTQYHCECFPKFFGEYCQYGPFCDPQRGKNMCKNNGKCRYFMGSLVNTCDCAKGFTGDKCEERTLTHPPDFNCKLGCSHGCERSEQGDHYCTCTDGFRLDEDNETCIEKEMYRISVELPLNRVAINSAILDTFVSRKISPFNLVKNLRKLGLSTATRLQYDGIRETSDNKYLLLHFFVEILQLPLVNSSIHGLITNGRFMNISVDVQNIKYTIDPDLKLLYVENYDQRPAIEGQLLTITCEARGSSDMTFHWYKDGYLVDVGLTDRNAWVVRIPRTLKDKQMSVLNIDGVTVYDKGTFTCLIGDFEKSQNKSVVIDVITYPHIEVTPLAVSVERGQQVGFRCVTPDDILQTFHYTWFKNGAEIVTDHGDEIIEDLLPSGSRLLVRSVTSNSNYTCYITNTAGTSNLTAYVFVLPGNHSNQICKAEKYGGVKWKSMGANNFDIERCPTDTGEIFVRRDVRDGYSKRTCRCEAESCLWSEPNFAKCQSGHLVIIYDRLEKLRLGYQHDNTSDIFDTLCTFIQLASSKMLAGDVDVSCYILHTFVKTLLQHPVHAPKSGMFTYKTLMDVMFLLLRQAIDSNDEEQRDLYVAPKLLDISFMLSKMSIPALHLEFGDSIRTPSIGLWASNLSVIPSYIKPNTKYPALALQSYAKFPLSSRSRRDFPIPSEDTETKTFSSTIRPSPMSTFQKEKMTVTFYFKQMFSLMKMDPSQNSDFVPVSDMFSIYLLSDWDALEERLEIKLKHDAEKQELILQNETRCFKWNSYSRSLIGYWSESDCVTVSHNLTTTTCWCRVPGTFAVFIKPSKSKSNERETSGNETIILVGCILSLCGLSAIIIVYMFTWRHLVGNVHCLHVNIVLSLAVVNMLCLMCLGKDNIETVCIAGKILIQFFYLAAFAFMFVESVHMFVTVHGGNRIKRTCFKYFIIGWGIPTMVIGSVVVASEKLGYDKNCIEWCWLSETHWHYYSFIIPVMVLIVTHLGLTATAFITVYRWKEEWRFKDRKKYMYQSGQMATIQILFTTFCVTGSFILHENGLVYSYIFILSDILLSCVLLIFYCILKKQIPAAILHIITKKNKSDYRRKFSTSSFRTFVMPEKLDEKKQTVEQIIQEHHNAVNRQKYTTERKKQLRFLLGSSGHYSDASTSLSCSTAGSGSSSGSDGRVRPTGHRHRDNIDSGFSEETCSERSYKNNCLVELHPLPVTLESKERQSQDSSKESYVLADFATNVKETETDSDCLLKKSSIQNSVKPIQKTGRCIFSTDGSADPLMPKHRQSVR